MKQILQTYGDDLALLIGNGVNRYGGASTMNSWNDLLIRLGQERLPEGLLKEVPTGVTLTEFYDVLELRALNEDNVDPLQKDFCRLMASWEPYTQHKNIVQWARRHQAPILTTNFEKTFAKTFDNQLQRTTKKGFTAHYPWDSYYSDLKLDNPIGHFAIWHVNGMERYYQSIRLGLTHYMGSVQRAREWLHRGRERLSSGKNHTTWRGCKTWLHIVFSTPLLIFGLGLEENEIFLRWLLLERASYFKKFPQQQKPAWYVHQGPLTNEGKAFFLKGVGIDPLQVNSYDDIYGPETWRS